MLCSFHLLLGSLLVSSATAFLSIFYFWRLLLTVGFSCFPIYARLVCLLLSSTLVKSFSLVLCECFSVCLLDFVLHHHGSHTNATIGLANMAASTVKSFSRVASSSAAVHSIAANLIHSGVYRPQSRIPASSKSSVKRYL